MQQEINIIGAGLAGSEAALQAASRNFQVKLYDMKPDNKSPAHSSSLFAELVCSNSLKAIGESNASGILKSEMSIMGSIVMESAYINRVEAGGALAVDRDKFSAYITNKILDNRNIEFISKTFEEIPDEGIWIIATGPLTSGGLYEDIIKRTGSKNMYFFDAAAPVVYGESIDMKKAFYASRYGKGGDDYINCPLDEKQYKMLVEFIIKAERTNPHGFEDTRIFEGCMPVEVMAARGPETLRFGPLKPVGLIDPSTGKRPHAVIQLRTENQQGTLYNLVGFQTNLKFAAQKEMLGLIPGLENAEIARFGVMHRNSYINSPAILNNTLNMKKEPRIFFAGQLTGVEGYLESAVTGILAGTYAALSSSGKVMPKLNRKTISGALVNYITDENISNFQPMNSNFGILRGPEEYILDKKARKEYLAKRAVEEINNFWGIVNEAF